MRAVTIARGYAEALFQLAEKNSQLEEFAGAFAGLVELLDSDERFALFLDTPKIPLSKKKSVVQEVFGGQVPTLFLNFLMLTLEKGRQRLIPFVAEEYQRLLDRKLGRFPVQITLARKVDEQAEEELAAKLSKILDRHVVPAVRVDRRILGGILVRYGDWVLDGTLRRRLLLLRRHMMKAVAPEDA